MYVCFNGGLGSLIYKCVLGNISNVWSQYFARKDWPTLKIASENPNAGQNLFSESHGFHLFRQHAFFTHVQAKFGKFLLAQVFLDFGCATFLSGDKPQIFGFIVMKSGPRRSLNTSLLRLLYAR